MRQNEEIVRLVHKRTSEIKERQKRRQQYIGRILCTAVCVFAIAVAGIRLPNIAARSMQSGINHMSGSASLLAYGSSIGYIIMGLLCFCLGVCVTVLMFRLHKRSAEKEREDICDDEL